MKDKPAPKPITPTPAPERKAPAPDRKPTVPPSSPPKQIPEHVEPENPWPKKKD